MKERCGEFIPPKKSAIIIQVPHGWIWKLFPRSPGRVCLYDMQTAGAYKDSYVGRVNWIDS